MTAQVNSPLSAAWWTRARVANLVTRTTVLVFLVLSIVQKSPGFGASGRPLAVAVLTVVCTAAWLVWMVGGNALTSSLLWIGGGVRDPDLAPSRAVVAAAIVMGISGGVLTGLSPNSAAIGFPCAATLVFAVRFSMSLAAPMTMLVVAPLAFSSLGFGHNSAIGYIGLVAGLFAMGSGRRSYVQRAVQAERLLAETRRANAEEAHAATLAERTRIAREIHDVLAHSLAALTVQLEVADALLTEGHDPARAHEHVGHAQRIAREGLVETRRAIAALREDAPPLPDLLRTLAKSYQNDTGAPVDVTVSGTPRPLSPDVGLALYRTAQEAFTNIRKHATGARVTCELTYDETAAELTVRNALPERGDVTSSGGYGLTGMRERATLLDGTLIAGPDEDDWRVTVRIPYRIGEAA
jgi:signal transduction histidine kinase